MATTTNYGWDTPDDTDLVKDGAAAIRTLGNSADTTVKNLNPETTLGDIAYRSATANTNTRLPIGSNGQILAVSGGVPAWINNDQGDITEVQAGTGISVASGTGPIPVVTNTVATAYDAKGDLIVGTGADTFSRLAVGTNGHTLVADSAQTTGLKWAAPSSPSFVGAIAYLNANQAIPNTAETAVNWDVEIADTNAFHNNSTNPNRFTVPAGYAGKYLFTVTVSWQTSSTSDRFITMLKNGTGLAEFSVEGNASVRRTGILTAVIDLAVSDWVGISAYQNSGGNLNVLGGNGNAQRSQANFVYLGA
jgi:hypothetical protein